MMVVINTTLEYIYLMKDFFDTVFCSNLLRNNFIHESHFELALTIYIYMLK